MMDNPAAEEKIKSVKARMEKLINDGYFAEAKDLLLKYESKMPGDTDICSMRAVIAIMEGLVGEAEQILEEGLKPDSINYDLLFNLAYVKELKGQYQESADYYLKAATAASSQDQVQNTSQSIEKLKALAPNLRVHQKSKIVFFVKKGMDNFLTDIIGGLSNEYWTRKIIVEDFKKIDEGLEWADICWFEWCDELIVYGSQLTGAKDKTIICRLHRYEVFTDSPRQVLWENVNKLILVTSHLKQLLEINAPGISGKVDMVVIENGVDLGKFHFKKRMNGFNLAMVGYIHTRKNPGLLLQIIQKLVQNDRRFKLFIAGQFQEQVIKLYWDYQVARMGLKDNVIFEGWQADISKWLEDKNYLVSTSIHESFGYGIAEAMSRGIKPVIHDFLYANDIWDEDFLFSTVDEAVESITKGKYESEKYRAFIENNFSLEKQLKKTGELIAGLLSAKTVLNRISNILSGNEKPEELMMDGLTVLMPCYNRAKMIKGDLDMGLKLGNQPKIIVDDCSAEEREWLAIIEQNSSKYHTRILYKQVNEGLAQSRWTGFQNIASKYTAFIDDDDLLLCLDREQARNDIGLLDNDYLLIVPRYLMNLSSSKIWTGYDRSCYKNRTAADILKEIASQSEIKAMLAGGSIGVSDIMEPFSLAREFRVAEDFVMISRMFAANPDKKIGITESLVHVRRVSNDTLSKALSPYKLATGLLAQCIACYYCLSMKLASSAEVLDWMRNRAALIQKLYDFGEGFESELIAYLMGDITEEVFIHYLSLHGFRLFDNLDELAPELPKMRELIYTEFDSENLLKESEDVPLVSIIIPTFNRCNMLKRAIDSALKQDYDNFEVVVIDNCSEDNTEEMVKSNFRNEKRLIYHRNERNLGPIISHKKALYEIAAGKYCITLFDDDYFIDSSYIREGVNFLEINSNVIFVFGDKYFNNLVENKVYKVAANQPELVDGVDYFLNLKTQKYPILPSINTVLFRRDIAIEKKLIKSETNAVAGDLTLMLRFSLIGDVGYINKVVLVYNLHKGSLSQNIGNRVTTEDDDGSNKALITAIDDIKEFTDISELAVETKNIDRGIINIWLKNRIFNYLYWRFNETIKTINECVLLLNFVKNEHSDVYECFRDFALKKYGETVLNELNI